MCGRDSFRRRIVGAVAGVGSSGNHGTPQARQPCHFLPDASGEGRENLQNVQVPLHDRCAG